MRVALVFLAAGLSSGATSQQPTTWSGVYSDAQERAGEATYFDRCVGCHQPDLSGGEDSPGLAGAQFGARWNGRTVGELFERMQRLMPEDAPGSLTSAEYAQLVAHLLRRNGFPKGELPLSDQQDVLMEIRFVALRPSR
jgi:mono/diheme cytochrome c family protein